MVVLSLHCCVDFSLVVVSRASPLIAVHRFLIAVTSLCKAQALGLMGFSSWSTWISNCHFRALEHRLSSCGAWAYLLGSMCNLPRGGMEPICSILAGRFFTTEPPGKPYINIFNNFVDSCFHSIQKDWFLEWSHINFLSQGLLSPPPPGSHPAWGRDLNFSRRDGTRACCRGITES